MVDTLLSLPRTVSSAGSDIILNKHCKCNSGNRICPWRLSCYPQFGRRLERLHARWNLAGPTWHHSAYINATLQCIAFIPLRAALTSTSARYRCNPMQRRCRVLTLQWCQSCVPPLHPFPQEWGCVPSWYLQCMPRKVKSSLSCLASCKRVCYIH